MDDKSIIRPLALRYAEIAALPEQEEHRRNWAKLNSLQPCKPVVRLDEICWHEFKCDELMCQCNDGFARGIEWTLRKLLFQWDNFRGDMVLPPFLRIGKAYRDTGFGVRAEYADRGHADASIHLYKNNIPAIYDENGEYNAEKSLEKLHYSKVEYLPEVTEYNLEHAQSLLPDELPVRACGISPFLAPWDRLVEFYGAENVLWSLIDHPEHMHALMGKYCDILNDWVTQLVAQGLYDGGEGSICHCAETYMNDEKWLNAERDGFTTENTWASGAAQIFSEVSPAMHDEYEIEYMKPIYDRFGWVQYGCCEPLHKKLDIVKKLKTVRAISVSPWADVKLSAEGMGDEYVMCRKPNPAYVALGKVDEAAVRRETRETLDLCKANGTQVMFLLKDISTVACNPKALTDWCRIVDEEINRG